MHFTGLPADLRGHWLWRDICRDAAVSHVLFRREFMVTEAPGVAELWIAAHGIYHLSINGRYFCRGASPAAGDRVYMSYFDVSHCMEIGRNVLAVVAHHANVSRCAGTTQDAGFWCQLNLDQEPTVWTDEQWRCHQAAAYLDCQPRVDLGSTFVEHVDLRQYPHGWRDAGFDDTAWARADAGINVPTFSETFVPTPDFEPQPEAVPVGLLELRGEMTQAAATTHVHFPSLFEQRPGLYLGECYVQAPAGEFACYVHCDDPYYFFVNEQVVKVQGDGGDPLEWADPRWRVPRPYLQDRAEDPAATVRLRDGWNKLTVVQQAAANSSGVTLVFPELDPGATRFTRGTDAFSLPGWNAGGPLHVPFANVTGSISLAREQARVYHSGTPCDVAAHLTAFAFMERERFEVNQDTEIPGTIDLESGHYVVLTLRDYVYGCLEMRLSGSPGDIVDVVYGDHIVDGHLRSLVHDRRRVYSITLSGRDREFWQAVVPNGMRHVMLVGRHVGSALRIENAAVRRMRFAFRDTGAFSSSDELLNQIWETSLRTFEATYDYLFMNSGGQRDGQLLGDAFIQAATCIFAYGNSDLSEKALREFAAAQYETGEIPAIAPSDFSVRLYDFALLWTFWLQKHIHYTDDRQLAEDLIPNLEALLTFFEHLADRDDCLIANSKPPYNVPCLIDYDERVERRGISTGLNSLYCLALLKSEWLFAYVGRTDEAKVCHRRAARIAGALQDRAWDPDRLLFADCIVEGQRSERCSLQTNVLALYAGVVPADDREPLFHRLCLEYAPFVQLPLDQASENPYFKFFVIDMGFALTFRDWALEFMRYYWGRMLQQGANTWWERFSPELDFTAANTPGLCHGYGVSPNYFIIREIVGIRPVHSGFLQVYFNPLLTACEWIRARISTPQGQIMVDWGFNSDGILEIVIEANFPLEVVPQLDGEMAADAVFHVSDTVSILETAG